MLLNLLMLHGNGGASTRFIPFLEQLETTGNPINAVIPSLSGFEGRPLENPSNNASNFSSDFQSGYWDIFLSDIEKTVNEHKGDWIYYGHGIGGSILLELAARNFTFPSGKQVVPKKVILHSCIGASLQHRFFPKLMKPMLMRKLIKKMVYTPLLQPYWEKKLFLHPEAIPTKLKNQFFTDYKNCAAFEVFFDLITPKWYQETLTKINQQPFIFLWGGKERVVASKYLTYWQNDFPQASFTTIKGWDHFPMFDTPDDFYNKLIAIINQAEKHATV